MKERDKAVLAARNEGHTWDQVARQLGLSYPQIARIRARLRRANLVEQPPTPLDIFFAEAEHVTDIEG